MIPQNWRQGQPEVDDSQSKGGFEWQNVRPAGKHARASSNSHIGYQPESSKQDNYYNQTQHLPSFGASQPEKQVQQEIQSPIPATNHMLQQQHPQQQIPLQSQPNFQNQQLYQRSSVQPVTYFNPHSVPYQQQQFSQQYQTLPPQQPMPVTSLYQQNQGHQGLNRQQTHPSHPQQMKGMQQQQQQPMQAQYSQQSGRHQRDKGGPSPIHCQGYDTRQISTSQSTMFLDLFTFKIDQCQLDPQNHNLKRCAFYHDFYKDRRRPLGTYQSEICPHVTGKNSNCSKGDQCERAHNRVEEFYHPDKYKAKFCSSYLDPRGPQCEYQEYCSFAHNQSELSIEMIEQYDIDMDFYMFHFKAVWCPYREDDHDRKICVYAHNWQDFRRRPSMFLYSSKMCPNWQVNNFISSYSEGCPNQYQCLYSHGWKEQEYHPDFLKIKQCQHGANCKKSHCPYYHSDSDRQFPIAKQFRYFPKTRVASFQTNFYLDCYGTKQNHMANKQTSFSSLPTEIICNQNRLNQSRGYSPDSTTFSTNSQISQNQARLHKQQTMRSNTSNGSKHVTEQASSGSQNSTSKRKQRKQGYSKQSQNSSGPNSAYQIANNQNSGGKQSWPLGGGSRDSGQSESSMPVQQNQQFGHQQQMHHQAKFQQKKVSDTQVKQFIQPKIVSNHFGANEHPGGPIMADSQLFPQSPVTQFGPSAMNHPIMAGNQLDSPLKNSGTPTSQAFSLSGRESYSGSANNSSNSANLGTPQNQVFHPGQVQRQGGSYAHPHMQRLSPQEVALMQRTASEQYQQSTQQSAPQYHNHGVSSDDPYRLNKRTISYGKTDDAYQNTLFVSGKFGSLMEKDPPTNQESKIVQDSDLNLAGSTEIIAANEIQYNSAAHNNAQSHPSSQPSPMQNLLVVPNQNSQGQQSSNLSNGSKRASFASSGADLVSSIEEVKQIVRNYPIEEECSSQSSSEADDKTNRTKDVQVDQQNGIMGHQEKKQRHGLLDKMKRGLRKLSIKKQHSHEMAQVQDSPQAVSDKLDPYREGQHPKSATIKNVSKLGNPGRRTSHLVQNKQGTEQLHSIQEEHQQLEESMRQTKSRSELGQRAATPEFDARVHEIKDGSEECERSAEEDNDQEREEIKAHMEAQIRDFDDDN